MKLKDSLIILLITAFMTLVGNLVGPKISPIEALPGILILVAVSFIGIALAKVVPIKIPSVAYIVTLATIMTIPGFPFSAQISELTGKVDFLALTTPILAYAGIYTGKNLDGLKKTGWKIAIVALFVMLGTYIGSALIAQVILKIIKVI
ncbi:DUF340 domain-containing protein [Microaceticoccus formicicus]|uniref:DUF340 domain-containing protein n=1 Tax=Microaceticoccus formicicus TaxID=3118105 RepID=UPI003CD03AC2|nr:DUF340 domain-containing protein [Peptoniphilaceae bacterium AMB_02]